MPSAATEARVLDALLAALQTIGNVPANWLTLAAVAEGIPGDPLPQPLKPRVYLQYLRTESQGGEAGAGVHLWRVFCAVWVTAADVRTMLAAKADVVRAIFNSEGTITTALSQPAYPGEFAYQNEMSQAGYAVGVLTVFVDMDIPHAAP